MKGRSFERLVKAVRNDLTDEQFWALKQLLAEGRYYGDGGTIHHTTHLDVGVDDGGVVQAVWFRCQMLPFTQYDATKSGAGKGNPTIALTGVEVVERD